MAILGLQGDGKSLEAVAICYDAHEKGFPVFSNIHLKEPFKNWTYVRSVTDLEKMRYGVVLLDEVWIWLFARYSMSKINSEISKIIALNRKRDISIFWTAQLGFTADRILRGLSRYITYPMIRSYLYIDPVVSPRVDDSLKDVFKRFKRLDSAIYNKLGCYVGNITIPYIGRYFTMYDTREEIQDIDGVTSRQGVELEHDAYKAICSYISKDKVYLIPNSGYRSPYPGDIIVLQNLIDVKKISEDIAERIIISDKGFDQYFDCQAAFGLTPFFMVKYGRVWYIVPITPDKKWIKNKKSVSWVTLKDDAIPLNTWITRFLSPTVTHG